MPDRNHPNLVLLCEVHNNIDPESIHLALTDMKAEVLNTPNMSLRDFLSRLQLHGQARDLDKYEKK